MKGLIITGAIIVGIVALAFIIPEYISYLNRKFGRK